MAYLDDEKFSSTSHFRLNNWLVKPESDQLEDGGNIVKIESKAMDTLVYLSDHTSRPVSNEELIQNVWQNTVVSSATIRRIIKNLRRDLGDDANNPIYIKTVPKRGYQLVCDVDHNKPTERFRHSGLASMLLATLFAIFYLVLQNQDDKNEPSLSPQQITNLAGREITPTLAPDGSFMIFAHRSQEDRQYQLMWRSFDQLTSFAIVGGGNAFNPVLSPDGQRVAFLKTEGDSCQISIGTFLLAKRSIEDVISVGRCDRNILNFIQWKDESTLYFENSASTNNASGIFQFELQKNTSNKVTYGHNDLNNVAYIASHPDQEEHLYVEQKGVQYELWRQAKDSKAKLIHTFNGRVRGLKYCGKESKPTLIQSDAIWQVDSNDQLKKLDLQTKDELAYFSCNSSSNKLVFSSRHLNTNIMMATSKLSFSNSDGQEARLEYLNRTVNNNHWPMFANTKNKVAFLSDQAGKLHVFEYANGEVSPLYYNESLNMKPYPVLWSPDDSNLLLMHADGLSVFYFADKHLQSVTDTNDNAITMTYDAQGNGIYYISANDRALYYADLATSIQQKIGDLNARDIAVHPSTNAIYFTKVEEHGLWQYDPEDSSERLIVPEIKNYSIFNVFDNGVYFNHRIEHPAGVYFYDFKNEQVIETLPKIDGQYGYQFSVSHDQSQIVFTVYDNYQSDIYLIQTD